MSPRLKPFNTRPRPFAVMCSSLDTNVKNSHLQTVTIRPEQLSYIVGRTLPRVVRVCAAGLCGLNFLDEKKGEVMKRILALVLTFCSVGLAASSAEAKA